MNWRLSGFGDEITDLFPRQLGVMRTLGIPAIEIRQFQLEGGEKKVIVDATPRDLDAIASALESAGMHCSAIGSPVGKYRIDLPFEGDLERFRGAVRAALRLGAPYIRMFSYYPPEGGDIRDHRDEVIGRVSKLADYAARVAPLVTLALENESDLYGEKHEECLDVLESVDAPNLGMAFDPCNFIMAGIRPYEDAWPLLKEHVRYFHIKDATAEKVIVPAGEGVARIPDILAEAAREGIGDYLSLEPHLKVAARSHGETGPELFKVAKEALDKVLAGIG